ncbi:MAG: extracellular solute-binding protein [Lachnospiraceae bacterium]|nr:extracellular solute-binding protein [Lachnospiraceae bacterium]
MGRGKQIIILFLIFVLGIGCFYLGYQIKTRPEPEPEETVPLGRYEETNISLPVLNESKGEEYLHLMRGMDGSVELFTVLYNEDKTLVRGYKKYKLNAELKWDEADAGWMGLEFFSDTNYVIRLMSYAETGSLYLVLENLTAEVPEANEVVRVSTDNEVEHVGVKGLYKTNEDGTPIQLTHMMIANNMIFVTDEHSHTYVYSLVSGELYYMRVSHAPYALASDGTNVYQMGASLNSVSPSPLEQIPNLNLIIKSNLSEGGTSATSIKMAQEPTLWERTTTFEAKESEYEIMDYRLLYSKDTLYLSCQDGIYMLDSETKSWQPLMAGIDCIFGRPSVIQQDFIESNDAFYSFSKDFMDGYYLTKYSRRPAEEEEEEEDERTILTISSYRRRAIITEAVVAFQQKNPSIKVVYEVALDKNPSLTIEAYQKQVQSALQSGTAADILVCDELDYTTYMSNGYFENISDLMKPMYTSANLYGNITNAMAQTKIFVTPAKFNAYFSYGSNTLLSSMNELEQLAVWSEKNDKKALSSFSVKQLTDLFASFYNDAYTTGGVVTAELLTQALTSFRTVASFAPGKADAEENWYAVPVSSEESRTPGITLIDSEQAFAEMLTTLRTMNASWHNACGRFEPVSLVGINSKSSNIKLSKEFLRTLYSEKVQCQNVGSGIPMSKNAIAGWTAKGIEETDLELLANQLQLLDCCYQENPNLRAAVYEVLELFLVGDLSAEDTATQILSYNSAAKASVYAPYQPQSNDIKVLFIGDAFTGNSGLVESFTALASLTYPEITVNSCVHSQETLKEQLKYIEQDSYYTYERIRNADIVVLQEKSSSLTGTVQAISRAMSYCKPEAKVYYLLTDKELESDILDRLSIFEQLTIIPAGSLAAELTENSGSDITLAQLYTDDSTNALYGYLNALTVYRTVFGTLPEQPDPIAITAEATDDILALVPGAGEAGKLSSLNLLTDAVDRYCEEYYK